MTADEFKGNVLEFYYDSQSLKEIVPKNVFQELRGGDDVVDGGGARWHHNYL